MAWLKDTPTSGKERAVAGFSYLTGGMVGLVYYLLRGGQSFSSFFMFHFYQSILCGVFWMLFNWTSSALVQILQGIFMTIPGLPLAVLGYIATALDLVLKAFMLVFLYGAITAFLGKSKDIPGIAKLARIQMRR